MATKVELPMRLVRDLEGVLRAEGPTTEENAHLALRLSRYLPRNGKSNKPKDGTKTECEAHRTAEGAIHKGMHLCGLKPEHKEPLHRCTRSAEGKGVCGFTWRRLVRSVPA